MKKCILFLLCCSFLACSKTSSSPRVMIMNSFIFKKFPTTTTNGGSWDVLPNTGPDLYLVIRDIRGIIYTQPNYFADCTASTVFSSVTFPTPLRISDINADLTFEFWDKDGVSDEFMGGLKGTPYADNNPVTSTVSTTDNQFQIEFKLSYEY